MLTRAKLSKNRRANITSYNVRMEDGDGNGKNWDLKRGPQKITSSGSLETVGSGILIYERLQLTLVFTHGHLWRLNDSIIDAIVWMSNLRVSQLKYMTVNH